MGQQLASRLRHDYPDGVTCRLVIPANWCLIHRVELPGSRWSKSAAEYEFEQYIPVDLEELTCTSIRLNPRDALVVAVFTDSLHEFLTVLEENLVIVEAVNVDAMLLSQDRDTRGADGSYGLILADDKRLTIMAVDARRGTVGQLRTTGMPKAASTDVLSRQVITAASFLKEPCAHWRVLPLSGTAPAKDIVRILESMGHSAEIDSKERTVEHVLSAASTAGTSRR